MNGGTWPGEPCWWHMPHIRRGCGVKIFCPLAKHNMKRIIFIIPTPIHCPEERSISWAKRMEHSTIRSQNPAATIPGPESGERTLIRMESLTERTNNGVCVRKYIYLRALPCHTKLWRGSRARWGGWWRPSVCPLLCGCGS